MGAVTTGERLDRGAIWVAATATVTGMLLLGAHAIPNPNITWDEAGQFWMTQGQVFGTPWGTPPGTLLEGLDLGRHGNILDPVGFTTLLWAWVSVFGAAPAALRALPFLFFIGTIVSAYLLGRRGLGLYRTPTLVFTTAVLTTYVSMQWATEVRPYSAELMGVVAAVAATVAYVRRPTWLNMVALSTILLFFNIFSRYSFAFAAGTSLLVVLLMMWRSKRLREHWRQIAFGMMLLGITALFLAWNIGKFDGGDQVWNNYGNPIRVESLTDFEHMRMLLQINFVYGIHKVTAVFIVLGLAAWVTTRLSKATESSAGMASELRRSAGKWHALLAFVVIYEAVCAVASQMGWAQWNSEFRHSIGLIGIAVISALGLLVLGTSVLHAGVARWGSGEPPRPPVLLRWATWSAWGLVLLLVAGATAYDYASFRRTDVETLGISIPTKSAAALARTSEARWLVDLQLFPSLRYLAEASGVPLGNLEFGSVVPFGEYGHNEESLLARMRDLDACFPGHATAILVAGSAAEHEALFGTFSTDMAAAGCALEVVPLSDVESMAIIQ